MVTTPQLKDRRCTQFNKIRGWRLLTKKMLWTNNINHKEIIMGGTEHKGDRDTCQSFDEEGKRKRSVQQGESLNLAICPIVSVN